MQAQRAQAEDALPDFARPGTFSADPKGVTLDNRFDGKRLLISPEYSDQTGMSLGGTFKLGAGGERLEYDYFTGKQSTHRATGSTEWSQQLAVGLNLKAGADASTAQNRYTLGLEQAYGEGWRLGVNLAGIRGRDGAPDDNQLDARRTFQTGFLLARLS